jgi:hypothetical protein
MGISVKGKDSFALCSTLDKNFDSLCTMKTPYEFLLLRQVAPGKCNVEFIRPRDQVHDVKFSGGRWQARRYLQELRKGIAWENVPAFCAKKSPRLGIPENLIEIPFESL